MIAPHLRPAPRRLACTASLFLFALFVAPFCHAAKAPAWVSAAAAKLPSFDYGDAHAAVLLDEMTIDVATNGTFTKRTRWIVKILTKDGQKNAVATLPYNTSSCRVKFMQGWLIRASGEVFAYERHKCIDVALFEAGNLYTESRSRIINAENDAEPGSVFAYEALVEEDSVFSQERWSFSTTLPVELSLLSVTLPKNWEATAKTFNHDPIPVVTNDRSLTWSLAKIPPVKQATMGPPTHSLNTWLALDIKPPPGTRTPRLNFDTWAAISRYVTPKYDEASRPEPTIKAKADALTKDLTTPWARIQALCRFTQNVNYVSIFMNIAAAGGMIPRPASKVLQANYGDCKDKANLLRALLRSQGIESYPLIVYSGDPSAVQSSWPSPTQFNHAILAIKLTEPLDAPGVLEHPDFGRLLIFDPTNPHTPPGWLAEEDCGGLGLLLAGENGKLITLPRKPKKNNKTERTLTAKLYPDGSVAATLVETYIGLASNDERRCLREFTPADYRKYNERWLSYSHPTLNLKRLETKDDFDKATLALTAEFAAAGHGKSMRDVLLVFKPLIVGRRAGSSLKKETRAQPVLISNTTYIERATIELPEGYLVDELPKPIHLTAGFGTYTLKTTVQDATHLLVERAIDYNDAWIPAADYETVRTHFEKIQKAEQTPVVLRRAPAPK